MATDQLAAYEKAISNCFDKIRNELHLLKPLIRRVFLSICFFLQQNREQQAALRERKQEEIIIW
jgi:hypothetical protein